VVTRGWRVVVGAVDELGRCSSKDTKFKLNKKKT
jgi:hypothetical protein